MPKFCINCGTAVDEGTKFCTVCGTKNEDAPAQTEQTSPQASPYEPQQAASPPPSAAPHNARAAAPYTALAETSPPKGSKYAPMSTFGYFGWLLLMSLPIAGLVVMLFLAFGNGPVNRRNLARAMLIFLAIGLIISIISAVMIWPLLSEGISMNWEL